MIFFNFLNLGSFSRPTGIKSSENPLSSNLVTPIIFYALSSFNFIGIVMFEDVVGRVIVEFNTLMRLTIVGDT